MLNRWHRSTSVLLMLTSAFVLSACASQPQVPVVSKCPQFPEPPPSLMTPPKASDALPRLEDGLRLLEPTAKQMPQD